MNHKAFGNIAKIEELYEEFIERMQEIDDKHNYAALTDAQYKEFLDGIEPFTKYMVDGLKYAIEYQKHF